MVSALMRRSAVTALLAAVATIASPLVGTGWAATQLGTPTNVAPSGTDKETQPRATFTYAAPVNEGQSSISIIDTTAGNAAVPCTLSFTNSDQTINCAVTHDLVDGHSYKASASVVNAADSNDQHTGANADTTTWTTDIPSEIPGKQSPANGSINKSVTSISVTFDEPISTDPTKIIVNIVNSANHQVQSSGHTSGTDGAPVPPISGVPVAGTAKWTSDVGGLAPSTYTATFRVFASPTPFNPANTTPANTADWGTATVTFTVDTSLPADAPSGVQGPDPVSGPGTPQITQANQNSVLFHGSAPVGSSVAVAIYDNFFDTHPAPGSGKFTPGTGDNDRVGSTVTPSCSNPSPSLNDVPMCPFSLTVNMNGTPDSGDLDIANNGQSAPNGVVYQWYAYTFTSAGQKPAAACPTGTNSDGSSCGLDATIDKDTSGPSKPNGGDAHWNASDNTVTVENVTETDTTSSFQGYQIQVVDPEGHIVSDTPLIDAGATKPMHTTNVDVSPLLDGPLTVNIYSVDQWGNLSDPDAASTTQQTDPNADDFTLIKEAVQTMPSVDTTNDTLTAGGTTYHFTCGSQPGCRPLDGSRVNTPASVTVYFNEPIKLSMTDTSGAPPKNVTITSKICLDDSTGAGSCLNFGQGTTAVTSDSMGLTWTAPAGFSLPTDSYSVSAFAISKYNCPDKTQQNSSTYPGCDTSPQPAQDPVNDSAFKIDNQPPTVQFTSVPAVDGNNVKATTITGTTDGDTTQIVLSIKSSGGGSTRIVPIDTTPSSDGTGRINWSTTQDLSTLPDGTLTLTAVGTDGAGNTTAQANAATATTTLAARPTAPQNLSATAGNGQAVLTWVAPASTGGVPLTGYTLTVTDTSVTGSTPQNFSVDPAATSYTATGLANGHAYSFALTASNNIGSGPAATTSATPKGNTALSAFATQGTITFGNFLAVHGTLSYFGVGLANEPVTISTVYFNRSHGTTYHATTDQNGNWVIAGLSPAKNVTYVASFAGDSSYNASSGAAKVFVRVVVRIAHVTAANRSHLTKVRLSGNVRPSQAFRRVYVYEVRAHGRLHYLGYAKLSSKSTWSFTRAYARGKHTLVARFLSQNGNVGNWSNRVRFTRT